MALALPRLVAITDLSLLPGPALEARLVELCRQAKPGSVAVLLRDHAASARERLHLGERLRSVTRDAEQELWVADRLDVALLLEADGLHLGEASIRPGDARRLLGQDRRISRAWHHGALTPDAELEGADVLLVSPIFEPRKGRPALGLSALDQLSRQLAARSAGPQLYGLGGVTAGSAQACLGAGAWGVAAIGAALSAELAPLLASLGIARS